MVRKKQSELHKTLSAKDKYEFYDPSFHAVHHEIEDEGDEYDDEETLDVGEVVGVEKLSLPQRKPLKARKEAPGPKFNVMKTEIARYTPDRGSMIVIRDDFENGVQPLLNGRRHGLIIEFWAYQDSQIGEMRPNIGIPFPGRVEL